MSGNPQVATPAKQQPLEFRYHADMVQYPECPPKGAAVAHPLGFRFVFKSIADPRNFAVQAKLDPKRFDGRPAGECCMGHGLSLFVDLPSLRDRANRVKKTVPNFLKKVGDHYAALTLTAASGRCTAANSVGHFTLFEYVGFDASAAVTAHGLL